MHEFGVFIGRFEPFHVAHFSIVKTALESAKRLIIVVGSAFHARTVKNPWSYDDRVKMITSCLTPEEQARVTCVPARDFLYNDNFWITSVLSNVDQITEGAEDVVLFGHDKDSSSFYLGLFPQWKFFETHVNMPTDATHIRKLYFEHDLIGVKDLVPAPVFTFLKEFESTETYQRLHEENKHIVEYKASWSAAPFPPVFVTVDAVVIRSGHVLVVRRRGHPGKGLLALPGGFVNDNETILNACLRELKEETSIKAQKVDIQRALVDQRVFDHPGRSLRGRTITHAFCFNLGNGPLISVKGTDDADKAWWMSLRDVAAREDEFFEDHAHIINHFTARF